MDSQAWTDKERLLETKVRRERTRYACVLVSIANDLLEGHCTVDVARFRLKKFLGVLPIKEEIKKWQKGSADSGSKSNSTHPEPLEAK